LAQNILNTSCFPYPQSHVVERQVTVLSDDLDPPTKSISAASAIAGGLSLLPERSDQRWTALHGTQAVVWVGLEGTERLGAAVGELVMRGDPKCTQSG